ncbi:hypothetical protein C4561_01380 [candidate division WWE3 bacterium]|uniref:Uncharacterized protein n=1 Tax=candidate division WWE3 bacterium TaxID=2053526 RepID=A0A3A4ZEX7_UNCKA|nr:MAG: hypothetical protein C4561_01380 [candidate division WWE3 bacterium]
MNEQIWSAPDELLKNVHSELRTLKELTEAKRNLIENLRKLHHGLKGVIAVVEANLNGELNRGA